jgi:hypothetical protein
MKKSKKSKKMNPAEALGKMQRAKMGMAVGSQLEGGSIVYDDDDKKRQARREKRKARREHRRFLRKQHEAPVRRRDKN